MRPVVVALVAAMLVMLTVVVLALVVDATRAAFSASTTNPGNSWQAGTVSITDDDSGTALFSATGLVPGDTGTNCVVVRYDGSAVPARVRLSGAAAGGTLGQYLDLTVQRGSGTAATGFGDCTGFSATETLYTGTVAGFATSHGSFATGVGTWNPSATGQESVYRFTWTLQDDNAAQGASVNATFTWEARAP